MQYTVYNAAQGNKLNFSVVNYVWNLFTEEHFLYSIQNVKMIVVYTFVNYELTKSIFMIKGYHNILASNVYVIMGIL